MNKFIHAVGGLHHSVIYTDIDGSHFRFSDGTWTWRNHNPGNVWSGSISKRHNQIGETYHFAIFPDDESGLASMLDTLITVYGDSSIHQMIYSYAPPNENPTKKYESMLRKNTNIYDDRPINKFNNEEFEKFWKTIIKMEGYKIGKITQVFRVLSVKLIETRRSMYFLSNNEWIDHDECVSLASKGVLELELCLSRLNYHFLKAPSKSQFQPTLGSLLCHRD